MVYLLISFPGQLRLSKSLVCYDLAMNLLWLNYPVLTWSYRQLPANLLKTRQNSKTTKLKSVNESTV